MSAFDDVEFATNPPAPAPAYVAHTPRSLRESAERIAAVRQQVWDAVWGVLDGVPEVNGDAAGRIAGVAALSAATAVARRLGHLTAVR